MLGLLAALLVAANVDAGTPRFDVKKALEAVFRSQNEASQQQKNEQVAALEKAAASASGDERALLNRMIVLMKKDQQIEKAVPELAEIVRALAKLTRGDFEGEMATAGAFYALPMLARTAGLDPEPLRVEALAFIRDVVARYASQARAHGLLGSALLETKADPKLALVEFKRCSELDPKAWCANQYTKLLAEQSRPRCTGASLRKPLTASGAHEAPTQVKGATVSANGQQYTVEAEPFLHTEDFASVSVDDDGGLALEVTPVAKARLEKETRRLVGSGSVMFRMGEEVLLVAHVMEPISEGRVRVSQGKGKPFKIEALCRALSP